MDKLRAIPQGYMTIGEIAAKMGVTVRTLQYYDKEGLLAPSTESEGGRRLYTDNDLVRLHQILSLKSLGFSLQDIREQLTNLDTPADVAAVLSKQAKELRSKIAVLSQALHNIELLKGEVLQMHSVDFKKYADIIVNLQMKNDYYWLIKHFDDQLLSDIRKRFDTKSGLAFMERFSRLNNEALLLQKNDISCDSEKGQNMARQYWEMIMEFTQGDMSMLPKLINMWQSGSDKQEWLEKQEQSLAISYIEQALDVYLTGLKIDPLQEGQHE